MIGKQARQIHDARHPSDDSQDVQAAHEVIGIHLAAPTDPEIVVRGH